MGRRATSKLVIALASAVCCGGPATPTSSATTPDALARTLTERAQWLDQSLREHGLAADDPDLTVYVESLLARLNQQSPSTLAVRVLATGHPVVFVLPSAQLYVSKGLIARLSTEPQLLAVLASELEHYRAGDSIEAVRSARRGRRLSEAFLLQRGEHPAATGNEPISPRLGVLDRDAGELWNVLVLGRYTPEQNLQADERTRRLLSAIGVPSDALAGAAHALQSVPCAEHCVRSFRWSQAQRLDALGAATAPPESARLDREYFNRLHSTILDAAAADIAESAYASARYLLERHVAADGSNARAEYLFGLLLRLTGDPKADPEPILAHLRRSVSLAGPPPEAFREIGLLERYRGHQTEARAALEAYLARVPDAIDAPIIRGYLKQ